MFLSNIYGMSALKLSVAESGVKNACVAGDKEDVKKYISLKHGH